MIWRERSTGTMDGVSESVETAETCKAALRLLKISDLNWLLHRAAQRFGAAQEAAAAEFGVSMRDQLVLTALTKEPARTQFALGTALGLDKTTLTTTLDRLEQDDLVIRRPHPTDRRVRVPEITPRGRALQQQVAEAMAKVEAEIVKALDGGDVQALREALARLVTTPVDGLNGRGGSCL